MNAWAASSKKTLFSQSVSSPSMTRCCLARIAGLSLTGLPVPALARGEARRALPALARGQRLEAALELVVHRRPLRHPPLLDRGQAIVAEAGLREGGKL